MKLTQSTIHKCFAVEHKGRSYYVDFLKSDGQILDINRNYWEISDEDGEELNIYQFKNTPKKQIKNNLKLTNRLIRFCIKHFNDYRPEL